MKNKFLPFLAITLIFLSGFVVRILGINWDDYKHYHPDERYITWVATSIELPTGWETSYLSHQTTLNPYYWPGENQTIGIQSPLDQTRQFAYGHFPLYLVVFSTRVSEFIKSILPDSFEIKSTLIQDLLNIPDRIEYHHMAIVGRFITIVFDSLTILVLYAMGKAIKNRSVGLVAAAFYAWAVFPIQLARFFTVDPYLTFFATLALYAMILGLKNEDFPHFIHAGIWIGFAVSSKFVGILLVPVLIIALSLSRSFSTISKKSVFFKSIRGVILLFILTNPFSIIDTTCNTKIFNTPISSCFISNLVHQSEMVSGSLSFTFTRQYDQTTAFVYPLQQIALWGLGPWLSIIAGLAIIVYLYRTFKTSIYDASEISLILLFVIIFFATFAANHVKFLRYFLPIIPALCLLAAVFLLQTEKPWLKGLIATAAIIPVIFLGYSFNNIHQYPHPWNAGNNWISENISSRDKIIEESGDTSIASPPFQSTKVNWLYPYVLEFEHEKILPILEEIATSDYYVIASNRLYGVLSRLPDEFPLSSQFHPLLFSGELGFELVFSNTRYPNYDQLSFIQDRFAYIDPPEKFIDTLPKNAQIFGPVDESVTVYDQPLVLIFKNTGNLSSQEMFALFEISEIVP